MDLDKKQDFLEYRGVDPGDIPNIDVYMDQLQIFFERIFSIFRRDPNEPILTKSMINNYVKSGIVSKPNKKKYSRNQIEKFIMIYQLKQVLAINDIKKLFQVLEENNIDTDFYNNFNKKEKEIYERLAAAYDEKMNTEQDLFSVTDYIIDLASEACAKKRLAEKLIDKL